MQSEVTKQAAGAGNGAPGTDAPLPVAAGSVLRRLIAGREAARTQPSASSAPAGVSIERAAATALGRAAEKQSRLPVFVKKVETGRMSLPEMPEMLPERALLTIVEGGRDAIGVVALCPDMLTALIEMQAIGRVTSRPAATRKPTRTDATISADFVNALLVELGRECDARTGISRAGISGFGAYRYATYMDDPRPLALMLEDGDFVSLTFRFRIGAGGQRDGTIMIALPVEPGMAVPQPSTLRSGDVVAISAETQSAAPQGPASLAQAMQDAPIRVVGILCRRKISLQALRNLTPGSLLPLPQNVLDEARVETPEGQLLARGRLGEADGFHAIRLRDAGAGTESAKKSDPDPQAYPHLPQPTGFDASGASAVEPPLSDLNRPDLFRTLHDPLRVSASAAAG